MEPTTRLKEFAEAHRLRLFNTGAERVVRGRFGEIADMAEAGALRLRLLAPYERRGVSASKALLARRRKALASGLALKWKGDAESILYFNPEDAAQAGLAIQLVGARQRRLVRLTDEQKQAIAKRLRVARLAA